MKLEVLLLRSRRASEMFAALAALENHDVTVQIWMDESEKAQIDRVAQSCSGNSRFQLFTHDGADRSSKLLHSAENAQGELQIELPIGAALDARGLGELAEVPAGTLYVASPLEPSKAQQPLALSELLDATRTAPQVAVAPSAILGHRDLSGYSALDVATFFVCEAHGGTHRLAQPLLCLPSATDVSLVERESRAAWRLQRLNALLAAARATGRDGPLDTEPLAPLGEAYLAALRALGAERNAEQRAGRFPAWRPAHSPFRAV